MGLLPAKAAEPTIDINNKATRTSSRIVNQKKLDTNSNELVSKLQKLQDNINKQSIVISLEDAISLGVKNNPSLEVAFREIQELEWQLIRAKRAWYPTFIINGGTPFTGYNWSTYVKNNYSTQSKPKTLQTAATPQTISAVASPQSIQTKSKTFNTIATASINWNFLDLSRQPDINAAEESLKRQKLLFKLSARNLILQIQQNYFSIQSNSQLIDSFSEIYSINKQQLDILSARQSIGMTTVLDVQQTKSQLYSQLNQLVYYTQQYITNTGRLAENLALPPRSLAIPNEKAKIHGVWTQDLSQTIEQALQQREEVLANIASAEAAKWRGIAALKKYLPVFSIQASGDLDLTNGYQDILVSENPNNQSEDQQNWEAIIGIGFQWNVFDGGISAANAESQFAQSRKLLAQTSLSKLQITQQVRSSYGNMETAKIGILSAEEAYRSAEIAQEAARARFDVGVGDIFSVVQAISLLSTAALQKSQSTLSYNNSIAELYRYSANWPMNSNEDVELRVKTSNQKAQP